MSIVIKCPGCGKGYKLRDELAGKRVKCKCGHAMTVPKPATRAESETYDLAPMGDPDAMSSLLDDERPTAAGPVRAAMPSAVEVPIPDQEPTEKRGTSPLVTRGLLGGLMVLPVIVILVVVWLAMRPGFGSPEDAYAAHQEALLKKKWSDLIETYSPQSLETILAGMMETLVTSSHVPLADIQAVFTKYGIQAQQIESMWESPYGAWEDTLQGALDTASDAAPEDASEDASDTASQSALAEATPEAPQVDYAEKVRKRRQRLRQLVSGVEDKAAFYVDLRTAVEALKEKRLPGNPVSAVVRKKPEGMLRRAVAGAVLGDLSTEGDSASATITFTPPADDPLTVPIQFQRVDGRWYVHVPGEEAYEVSPFRPLMGGKPSWL